MTHPEIVDPEHADPEAFTKWLAEYPKGALGQDLAKALAECVQATQLYGGPSLLNLKVRIEQGEGYGDDLAVSAVVDTKPARPKPPKITFFPTATGGLSRRDPNQPSIPGTEQYT